MNVDCFVLNIFLDYMIRVYDFITFYYKGKWKGKSLFRYYQTKHRAELDREISTIGMSYFLHTKYLLQVTPVHCWRQVQFPCLFSHSPLHPSEQTSWQPAPQFPSSHAAHDFENITLFFEKMQFKKSWLCYIFESEKF